MKVAVLSESPADEAAIKILVDGILGFETERIDGPRLETRGYPSIIGQISSVYKHLYFCTEAEAFVVFLDADDSEFHKKLHEKSSTSAGECRLCKVRNCITNVRKNITPVPHRSKLNTAVGIAYPFIEAWFCCGRLPGVGENNWKRSLKNPSGLREKKLEIKRQLYNTDHHSLSLKTQVAITESTRLSQDIDQMKRLFPVGFGSLVDDVSNWVDPAT